MYNNGRLSSDYLWLSSTEGQTVHSFDIMDTIIRDLKDKINKYYDAVDHVITSPSNRKVTDRSSQALDRSKDVSQALDVSQVPSTRSHDVSKGSDVSQGLDGSQVPTTRSHDVSQALDGSQVPTTRSHEDDGSQA